MSAWGQKAKDVMKVLQTNLGRGRGAHDLAYVTAKQLGVDILIVNEPNKSIVKSNDWLKDRRCNIAVFFLNKKLEVYSTKTTGEYIHIRFRDYAMYCCYISPNISIEDFESRVDTLMNSLSAQGEEVIVLGDINSKSTLWGSPLSAQGEEVIVLGDINSKSTLWGSPTNDRRGVYWTEWMAALNLVALNTGDTPTFRRGDCRSYIDVTCSTQEMARKFRDWRVLKEDSLSDHAYIFFQTTDNCPTKKSSLRSGFFPCDWDAFILELEVRIAGMADTAKLSHQQCTKAIKAAYKNSVRRVAGSNTSPYCWNDTISTKRTECTSARRAPTRLARNNSVPDIVKTEAQNSYRVLKKQLCKLIRQEKRKQWLTLCKKLEEDIWGDGYRIAVRELKNLTPYDR
ncbi:Endonuclease-reverse transcriptase [Popillia japonica]|uniref:Endonuclease-reverse transcriptase n=1 Tax=Popillia japonica TaxID=7064 RepID=A0AAW1NDI5_POPJA